MDPYQLAQNLLQKHFPKFGGIRKSTTYQVVADSVYDAETGSTTNTVTASYPDVLMIWDEFSFSITYAQVKKFDDSTILSIDRKVIFPSLDLPVAPAPGDRVVDDSSVTWSIIGISVDPADAHYELHVRPLTE